MKKIIDFFKNLLGSKKPEPKVIKTVAPTKPLITEQVETFDYNAVHCETGYKETVKSYNKLKKGTVFFMSNRDNTGCYSITSSSKTPGKRTLRKNIKTFTSCEECTK